jgi:hypothetical protein
MGEELRYTITAEDKASATNRKVGMSLTDIRSGLQMAADAYRMMSQAVNATITPTIQLAANQRDLARITGSTAEEAGILIQATDDMGISYAALEAASKKLNAEGLSLTLESLTELRAEYAQLSDPVERARFATEHFGKSAGPEMQKALDLSTAAFDEFTAGARESGLVLSNEAVVGAREYEIAQDDMNDSIETAKVLVGQELVPMITELSSALTEVLVPATKWAMQTWRDANETVRMAEVIMENAAIWISEATGEITAQEAAQRRLEMAWKATGMTASEVSFATAQHTILAVEAAQGDDTFAQALISTNKELELRPYLAAIAAEEQEALTASTLDEAEAEALVSERLSALKANMAGAIGGELESFRQKNVELQNEASTLKARIEELNAKKYLTPEQRQELEDTKTQYSEAREKIADTAKEHEIATKKILFGIIEQRLAMEGMTMDESTFLVTLAEKWGMVDHATATATQTILLGVEEAQASGNWDALYGRIDETKNRLLGIPDRTVNVDIFYNQHGEPGPDVPVVIVPENTGNQTWGGAQAEGGVHHVSRPTLFVAGDAGGETVAFIPDSKRVPMAESALGDSTPSERSIVVNLTYAPLISTGDRVELQTRLKPLLKELLGV